MKKEFSIKWKGSKQPRKQRKYRANAPLNVKHKLMSANLSKDLRKKYEKRSFPIKKGDSVKVMTGSFKGKSGKIDTLNLKKLKVSVEGLNRTKKDGTKLPVFFNPSNLQIKELTLEDIKRKKSVERKLNNKGEKNAPEKK